MDGIKGIDANTLSLQLKSLVIFEFLKEYNKLEQAIRKVFEDNVQILPPPILQQLYFYYGGKIGTYIEYEAHQIKLSSVKFREGELFKDLSINQIVKIFKNNNCLKAFDFSVESIQHSTNAYSFYDCMARLISMRNKLAHEVVQLQFRNQDLIELLSHEQIAQESFDVLQNYDIQKMDDMTLYIASNTVYIRKLIYRLEIEPPKATNAS